MAQDIQWSTISEGAQESQEETKIVFDTIGDAFVGTYLGMREIDGENGKYKQARFEDETGNIYFCNANYDLRNGLKTVRAGSLVRVEYVADVSTGHPDNPMRAFRVQVGRSAPKRPLPNLSGSDNS